MILLADCGNTRLHLGSWDGTCVQDVREAEYGIGSIAAFTAEYTCGRTFDGAAACSVSRKRRDTVFPVLADIFPGLFRIAPGVAALPIRTAYARPESMGVDRALAAIAAWKMVQRSCVVVDAGTAVTIDGISGSGEMTGGFIFPGFGTVSMALATVADLPATDPTIGTIVPGTSTESCIANALAIGFPAAVARLVEVMRVSSDADAPVVLAGGGAEFYAGAITGTVHRRPLLVLEGLGLVMDYLVPYRQ